MGRRAEDRQSPAFGENDLAGAGLWRREPGAGRIVRGNPITAAGYSVGARTWTRWTDAERALTCCVLTPMWASPMSPARPTSCGATLRPAAYQCDLPWPRRTRFGSRMRQGVKPSGDAAAHGSEVNSRQGAQKLFERVGTLFRLPRLASANGGPVRRQAMPRSGGSDEVGGDLKRDRRGGDACVGVQHDPPLGRRRGYPV